MVLVRGAEGHAGCGGAAAQRETIRILKLPELQKRLTQDAFDPREFTPEQLTAYFESEMKRWQPVAQEAGMRK